MAFLNLLLVYGTALGSVPILIHLLNKQRFKPVRWAAMEFLLEAFKQNSRRLQLRDLIMMMLRTLAVVSLAMALARPTVAGKLTFLGGVSTGAVILIDNSLSMGYSNGKHTRLDAAKEKTKAILGTFEKGTWCAIYAFSSDCRQPLGDPSLNLDFLKEELDRNIFLADGVTNLELALQQVQRLFRIHPEYKIANKELYLVTDLQAAPWDPKRASNKFAETLADLSRQANIYLVDAGDSGGENAALVDFTASEPLAVIDMPVDFEAKVRNFGETEITGLPIEFFLDPTGEEEKDRPAKRTSLDLGPGETRSVAFQAAFKTGGDHRIEVRIGNDRLLADNRRFATLEVIEQSLLLLVDGADARLADPLAGESCFLKFALAPLNPGAEEKQTVVTTETVTPLRLADRNINRYQAMALCNVTDLPAPVLKVLAAQVRSGMGLLIFLGDQTDPVLYNAKLGPQGADLLPARIGPLWGKVPEPGEQKQDFKTFAVEQEKISHPLLAFFNDPSAKPLLSQARFYKGFALEPEKAGKGETQESGGGGPPPPQGAGAKPGEPNQEARNSQVVAWFSDGSPAIVEKHLGSGTILLFPFPAKTLDFKGWSNLPTQFAFPILIQRALARLALGNRPSKNIEVGAPIQGFLPLADQAVQLRLSAPNPIGRQETQPEPTRDGRAFFQFRFPEKAGDKAGFYEVVLDKPGAKPAVYSLSPNCREESHLARILEQQIRKDYQEFQFVFISQTDDLTNKLTKERQGVEIWPWFMALVFLALGTESFLAFRWAAR